MFMKFMVCFDGSNTSKAAMDLAINHASAFRASLIIVNSMVKGTESERERIQNMESLLSDIKKECETNDISCETHLLIRGLDAGEDLVAFAHEQQVDQVFIGVKRRSKVEKLVFGSTAQYVILNANCPVVTIR
jgi:nucleotide-binding universal stress UspA family protein